MKKSLIALAVLAASGAAMAQTSVTLYGIADVQVGSVSVENNNNNAVASVRTTRMDSGNVNGSRWGLKGAEDLGGGLSAIFDLQSGFSIDTGASGQGGLLFGRQAAVGLQGGFGTVKMGRVILPFYENEGMNDAMMNSSLSAQSNVMRTANNWGTAGNNGTLAAFEINPLAAYALRGNNAFRYDTPNFSGFVGSVAYAMDEKTQSTAASKNGAQGAVASASLVYANGPISGVVAYQVEKPYQPTFAALGTDFGATIAVAAVPATATAPAKPAVLAVPATTASDRKFFRLSGQYDFGMIIAKAGYGRADNVNYMQGAKTNEYQLGMDYKLTPAMLLSAGIATSKDDATTTVGEVKRTALTLGGKYSLSKRTFLYGGYEAGKQTKAGFANDAKESIFALGVQHRF